MKTINSHISLILLKIIFAGAETIVELWLNIPNDVKIEKPLHIDETHQNDETQQNDRNHPINETSQETRCNQHDINDTAVIQQYQATKAINSNVTTPSNLETTQNSFRQTPIKLEKTIPSSSTIAHENHQSKICDSNILKTSTATSVKPLQTKVIPIPTILSSTGKKLIKCVTKDGKVSFIELVQDVNNPKLFKMVLPKPIPIEKNSSQTNTSQSNNQLLSQATSSRNSLPNQQVPLANQKIAFSNQNLSPATAILQKNRKIFAIDSNRPQQSLLKPQISLLKPIQNTPLNRKPAKVITVSNIAGVQNKNINVFIPSNIKMKSSIESEGDDGKRNIALEFEKRFLEQNWFSSMTDAVNWLFKQIPLISLRALKDDYRDAFPFVTPDHFGFQSLHLAKKRSFEVSFTNLILY